MTRVSDDNDKPKQVESAYIIPPTVFDDRDMHGSRGKEANYLFPYMTILTHALFFFFFFFNTNGSLLPLMESLFNTFEGVSTARYAAGY